MQFCQTHWGKLKAAIDERNLSQLVAKDGVAAAKRLKSEFEGSDGPDDFDPLMALHNMLWGELLSRGGLEIMAPNDDGSERCPLCYANESHERDCSDPECHW